MAVFFEQSLNFKFKKNLVYEGSNQQRVRNIDFRAPGGREFLWTTDEKTKQQNIWIFLFEGFDLAQGGA
jgi:hypothetical protein